MSTGEAGDFLGWPEQESCAPRSRRTPSQPRIRVPEQGPVLARSPSGEGGVFSPGSLLPGLCCGLEEEKVGGGLS